MDRDERDTLIAKLYLGDDENEPVPAEQLSRDFSLSIPMIRKILKAKGAVRKDQESKSPKQKQSGKPLSHGHTKIGLKLYTHRQLVNVNNREQGASKLGWSANKLARVEKGTYDLSLTDLLDIATYMKIPLTEIVKDL